jgi:transcriptional regulator with XRE-family HTH domain
VDSIVVDQTTSVKHDLKGLVHLSRERKEFGQRLVLARLDFGKRQKPPRVVTQTEIAEALGVFKTTVSSWELGKKEPDLGTIHKLAFVLGVRVGWLVAGEEPMRAEAHEPPPRRGSRSA